MTRPHEGYPDDWNRRRKRVFTSDRWQCQGCGRVGGTNGEAELHAHHIVPKADGGGDELGNLTTLCDRYHAAIHNDHRLLAAGRTGGSSWAGHLIVAITTAWWTLGLGNVAYELHRRRTAGETRKRRQQRRKGIKRLRREARQRKRGSHGSKLERWHNRVDSGYNEEFGGCPSCGREQLAIDWDKRRGRKVKIIECGHCHQVYNESVVNGELALEPVNRGADLEGVSSGFEYELEKHLQLDTIDDLGGLKAELLNEVDTEKERQYVRKTFEKYE